MYKIYVNGFSIDGVCDWEMAKALVPTLWKGVNQISIVSNETGLILFDLSHQWNGWEVYCDESAYVPEVHIEYGMVIIN